METRHRKQTSLVRALLIGGGASLLTGGLLILLVGAILMRTEDPTAHLLPAGLACLAVTALCMGWLSVRVWGHDSLFPALICGGIFAVLVAAGGLAVPGSTLPVWLRCTGVPAILLLALTGGLFGRKRKPRRRRR